MYNQSIRLQHRDSRAFLHANGLNYPAQYEDGRYSSRGLQVTGILQPDIGSYWRVKPSHGEITDIPVRHNDVIRLEHIATGLDLLTHDVAAPWMPTNQEFTLTNQTERYNETLFRVLLDSHKDTDVWNTVMKSVRLVHVKTNVALWCHQRNLPEWGLHHLEVNGNKRSGEPVNFWTATDILGFNGKSLLKPFYTRFNDFKQTKKLPT